jgi:hypothetical protein
MTYFFQEDEDEWEFLMMLVFSGIVVHYLNITSCLNIEKNEQLCAPMKFSEPGCIPCTLCNGKELSVKIDVKAWTSSFAETVQTDADSFVPPGEKIAAYAPIQQIANEPVEYGIYKVMKSMP